MSTTNISHTVLSAKPVSAHRIEPAGSGATRPRSAAIVTPSRPITGLGIGSVTSAAIVATNSAKKCHALGVRPWGAGTTTMPTPSASGTIARRRAGDVAAATSLVTAGTLHVRCALPWLPAPPQRGADAPRRIGRHLDNPLFSFVRRLALELRGMSLDERSNR